MSDIGYWWCRSCKCEVAPSGVTFSEHHEDCGCRVEWLVGHELTCIEELEATVRFLGNAHHDEIETRTKNTELQSRIEELEAENERLKNGLMTHEGVNAFWEVWKEVGEPHKHGVYESTWMAFRAAIETRGKVQLAAISENTKLKAKLNQIEEAISTPLPENLHFREVDGCSLMAERVRSAIINAAPEEPSDE